jgi:long-chain-fatty-acid--CoA ligase ACSBG
MSTELSYTSTDIKTPVKIAMGTEGPSATIAPSIIPVEMEATAGKYADKIAMTSSDGKTWKWSEYYSDCKRAAKSFISLGMEQHDCINIIGFNSPEWLMADVGAILGGGVAAGIYTSNNAESCFYVSDHSEAKVVVCDGEVQLAKFLEVQARLPNLKGLVVYNHKADFKTDASAAVPIYSWDDFMQLGETLEDDVLEERKKKMEPGHCCALIYTSGTTGPPKAVMISHDNVLFTAKAQLVIMDVTSEERVVSYLPLSHIAAQMLDIMNPIVCGYQIFFARPDALKGTIVQTLQSAKPTIFFGVPRVWEKIQEKMLAVGRSVTGLKKKISTWAKAKGLAHSLAIQKGSTDREPWFFGVADKIVFSKVKENLGLSDMKMAFSAAAPISVETIRYFAQLNIQIMEVFGQSECTGPCTLNYNGMWKIGAVGVKLPGTEVKIAEGTGEIIYRGRHIFMGYMKMEEKTTETIPDGYLHSGDVGSIDSDGFLRITGRIKELIITAGGENIAPVLIEDTMKKHMPFISNVMIIGDKRKFLSFIMTLKVEMNADGTPSKNLTGDSLIMTEAVGSKATTTTEAKDCDLIKAHIEKMMGVANDESISKAQRVQKFVILEDDFSQFTDDLTPTLKLKRSVVHKKYLDVIESIYA